MKKLINRIKKINTTKKYLVIFLMISFVFIVSIGVYNTFDIKNISQIQDVQKKENENKHIKTTKSEKNEEMDEVEKEKYSNNKDDDFSKNDSESKNENSVSKNKKETEKINKQESQQSNHSQDNTSINEKSTQPVKETIHVSIRVDGIGTTIMEDSFEVDKNATPYSVLKQLAKNNGIKITTSGFGSMIYVKGIGSLNEYDYGPSSGWMYSVNGISPNVGAGSYTLKEGSQIVWYYVNYE